MLNKQQIKEKIDELEVNGAGYDEIMSFVSTLNDTERYLVIVELEYRGIIYDYDGYPVIPDRYNFIMDDICDADVQNITQLKQYYEEL